MSLRERPDREARSQGGHPGAPGESLERLRGLGEAFLAAGDEAIRRGLSADSEAFVRAARQHGGQ